MNINELMQVQKELDFYIVKEKNLKDKSEKDMLNATFCAAFSEVYEVIEAPKEMLCEELVDVLHFVLSLGYRLKLESVMAIPVSEIESIGGESTEKMFDVLFKKLVNLMDHTKSYKFWSNKEPASIYILSKSYYALFLTLWNMLRTVSGSDEAIIREYKKKYEINILRQRSGY